MVKKKIKKSNSTKSNATKSDNKTKSLCKCNCSEYSILILRIFLGLSFIFIYGLGKMTAGPERWVGLATSVGFTMIPVAWGLLATLFEFIGGIFVLLGLYTRYAALAIASVMVIIIFGRHLGDLMAFQIRNFILVLAFLVIALSLVMSGGGNKLNLEKYLFNKEI
ncbi:MAG: DoxX family protein [Candidatus Woesearchaeota archaeon]